MRFSLYNKYHATKTIVDNITFASKKESVRYKELKLLLYGKVINDLVLQPKFELQAGFRDRDGVWQRPVTYIADFKYIDASSGNIFVEDVKAVRTKDYLIKKKLFLCKYPTLIFREV